MSSKSKKSRKTKIAKMISLIDHAITIDHATRTSHYRHLIDGPLPSAEEQNSMISQFASLWSATDIDFNTAATGYVSHSHNTPLTMLAYAIGRAQTLTQTACRRLILANGGIAYVPPCKRPSLDGIIWSMLVGRPDLDMSTLDYNASISLITSLSDEHAMNVMQQSTFNVNPVDKDWRPPGEDFILDAEANTLIGWLVEFGRCTLIDTMVRNMPDSVVINRRHEFMFWNDEKAHLHVAMLAAVMTNASEIGGDIDLMIKAEQSLVAILAHPETDISQSTINPNDPNVFCIRKLLQHKTVDIHKIVVDEVEWEGEYDDEMYGSDDGGDEDENDSDDGECECAKDLSHVINGKADAGPHVRRRTRQIRAYKSRNK